MTPLESELGWAAGIIDGEGSIQLIRTMQRGGGKGRSRLTLYECFSIRLSVGNTNMSLLQRFAQIIPGGAIYIHSGQTKGHPNKKPAWQWIATGPSAAAACSMLKPYIFSKSAQCVLLLQVAPLIHPVGRDGRQRFKANPHRAGLRQMWKEMARLNRRGARPVSDRPEVAMPITTTPQMDLSL